MRRHYKTMYNFWMAAEILTRTSNYFLFASSWNSLHSTRLLNPWKSLFMSISIIFHLCVRVLCGFVCRRCLRKFVYIRIKQIFQLQHLFIILTFIVRNNERKNTRARQHGMTFLSRLFPFLPRLIIFGISFIHNFCSPLMRLLALFLSIFLIHAHYDEWNPWKSRVESLHFLIWSSELKSRGVEWTTNGRECSCRRRKNWLNPNMQAISAKFSLISDWNIVNALIYMPLVVIPITNVIYSNLCMFVPLNIICAMRETCIPCW